MNHADVLIVEDSPSDVEMIMDSLQESKLNIRTLILKDGAEAIDYFFNTNGKFLRDKAHPKLVLLDLKLPKVSGLEVLKKLKSSNETKHIPVVVFTSSDETQDRMDSYKLGANSYLLKPSDADEFSKFIVQIMNYWTRINANARH